MAIFDLQCRGTEGDLTGDGKVTETDFAILNLMVNGQLEVISGIEDCADINDDGIVDEEDVECMQALFSGEREEWLICLDCQQNLPAEAYGDEICGDGYDNNCDNLKDKEDPICNCDENTPCDTKYDTDGGSSPGVSDGNYKKCRKLSWESEATGEGGWNWYTEDEIKCSKEGDSSCGAMQCEDKIYKCSSGTGGATGKWYEIPEYCCWRGDNGGVGTYSKFAWIEWTHDFVAAQASDHMWSACLTTEKLAAQGLTCESFKARVAAGESLSSLGFTNNGYKGSGDIVFLPQGPCNWQYQGASSNYYLPYEDSWRNKGDGWDNNCYTGDCSS
jgi:hypothetical protein